MWLIEYVTHKMRCVAVGPFQEKGLNCNCPTQRGDPRLGPKNSCENSGNCNDFIPNFHLLRYFSDTLHECIIRNGAAQVIYDTLCLCDTIRDCVSTLCILKPYTYRFDTLHTFLALYSDTLHTYLSDILFRHPTCIPAFAGDPIRDMGWLRSVGSMKL